MPLQLPFAAAEAVRLARKWLALDPLFLDTETTGLGNSDQVLSVAVVDARGLTVFDALVCPTVPIHPEAEKVHGYSAASLAECPTYAEVEPQLSAVLTGRHVVIYNAAFDLRLLYQSMWGARPNALKAKPFELAGAHCAMELYAQFHGQRRGSGYQSQKLGAAVAQCGLARDDDPPAHHARHDAELARRVVVHLAGQPLPGDPPGARAGYAVIDTDSKLAGDLHGVFHRLHNIPVKDITPSPSPKQGRLSYELDLDRLNSGERERLAELVGAVLAFDPALAPAQAHAHLAEHGFRIAAGDVRSVALAAQEGVTNA